ncbi:hypothetical protein BGZ99_010375, partial [Dissophora globulifera]
MTNACRRHQLIASKSVGAIVYGNLQDATFQLPNDSAQAPDLEPFSSPQITNVSDAASVTIDTTATTAAAAVAVAALDPPQRELLPAPPLHSGQSEDTNRGAALPRAKIISSIASFLSLC